MYGEKCQTSLYLFIAIKSIRLRLQQHFWKLKIIIRRKEEAYAMANDLHLKELSLYSSGIFNEPAFVCGQEQLPMARTTLCFFI